MRSAKDRIVTFEHPQYVNGVAFSSDGMLLASACNDKNVYVRDVATGRSWTLWGHAASCLGCAFSPHSKRLATRPVTGHPCAGHGPSLSAHSAVRVAGSVLWTGRPTASDVSGRAR